MNDQQKIDCLNTIINERESAVWLKEIIKDALVYLEEKGQREARLKDLDVQCEKRRADLDGLEKTYKAKESNAANHLKDYEKKLESDKGDLDARAEAHVKNVSDQIERQAFALKTSTDRLAAATDKAAQAEKKQHLMEAALEAAVKKYEEYKASLK